MKQIIAAGQTSYRVPLFVANTSGAGVNSLLYNSAGLEAYYYTNTNGTSSAITLANETLGTWTSGGFIAVDTTNMPGVYEFGVPNACVAAGVSWCAIILQGASGMLPVTVEFEVTPVNVLGGTMGTVTSTITATVPSLSTNVNVQQWLGTAVTSNAGVPITTNTGTVTATVPSAVTVSGTVTATVPTQVSANVTDWLGTAVTSNAGIPVVYTTNTVPANVVQWLGTAVTSNAGVPLVDVSGTVTATVVGGTIATVTNPVSLTTGQLTVKRNTALNGFTFPMYNASSGNPATGLTVSASRTIDGGALAATANSPTEIGSGIYSINLAASDLNGTTITLVFVASSASATIVTLITQA